MKKAFLKIGKAALILLAALVFGGAAAFAMEWIALGDAQAALDWCRGALAPFCLTAMFYGGAALFLALLTGRLWIGTLGVSAVAVGLALVSYFKFAINGSPLELEDFGMIGQVNQVMGVAGNLTIPGFAWAAMGMLVLATLFFLLLGKKLTLGSGRTRFLLLSFELALILGLTIGPGASALGQAFSVNTADRIMSTVSYRDYGLTLGLWRDACLLSNREPNGYDAAYMDGVVKRLDELLKPTQPTASAEDTPNVIFILSESFYDMTRLPGLSLSADPAENFHRLSEEGISGRFYTSYLGYGTGYIEQSIFSGLTGKDLAPGTNICFRDDEDYSLLDSIVTPFQKAGYETEMLHAYNNSLYNRMVTYPRLGFNRLLFSAQMQALDLNIQGSPYAGGYYLSDHVFTQALLSRLDAANADGKKAFLFGISMENHQPFDPEKFGYECQISVTSEQLDQRNLAITRVMLEGLTRADEALGELADALREREEPTVVVFFGDHRPNLFMTDGGTVYSHLGLCDGNDCSNWDINQVADLYSTDYLIWANDAALLKESAGTRQDTGLTSLGPAVLNAADMPKTRYWAMQERLSKALLVNTDLYCVTAEGTPYWNVTDAQLTNEDRELMELRDAIVYDTYYGNRYVTDRMNQTVGA
ncbi:MAG: LTA synthase family protein [Oscillibacter ruminantium]|uniref:LTA synthase family protein n=1 Tax=Oscillibacter ruminantium TaxID=1263547 RepID=UPI002B1F6589|nr:LTA synthase family protein [Oscillibacter ruminantium]MEA5041791.1 LTA synthase family protein [Oscillibacter ruminantium]